MAAMIVAVAVVLSSTTSQVVAFSPSPLSTNSVRIQHQQQQQYRQLPVSDSNVLSTTALNLKIDPSELKSTKGVNPGAAKGAAYAGSIVIAVLLPVAFLAWSALQH
eukprot:CAMPEP_0113506260 /NCGR_PEP_ID=MMETSP0014_2-20120614/35806_1 /TAXON_ID=2857 /ORGANISM="Nitzschia sp." /LENGTH=105 /DNA_ID=CAMNT_0000401729 /DNA_START=161 /DNA_END=478 /DNA_ORIENTATION=- /assembly_acc=CAM_ASM_000159